MGVTEISQNDDDFVDTAAELDASIMEESVVMAHLQRLMRLVDHATGTATEFDVTRMEESAAMVRLQPGMGLIYHVKGGANVIFGGDWGGCGVGWGGFFMGRAIKAAMVG